MWLNRVTKIPKEFKPVVNGLLELSGVTKIPKGFKSVCDNIYLAKGLKCNIIKPPKLLSWLNGKYIKADGIFTDVTHKRGNVYKVRELNSIKEFYLVTDGEYYSHGDSIKEANDEYYCSI